MYWTRFEQRDTGLFDTPWKAIGKSCDLGLAKKSCIFCYSQKRFTWRDSSKVLSLTMVFRERKSRTAYQNKGSCSKFTKEANSIKGTRTNWSTGPIGHDCAATTEGSKSSETAYWFSSFRVTYKNRRHWITINFRKRWINIFASWWIAGHWFTKSRAT